VNFPVTSEPTYVSRNAKTLGLQHLQVADVAASSGPPDLTCMIHHATDELPVEHQNVFDGQAASLVKEGAKHAQSLGCLLSYLADVCRSGQLSVKSCHGIPCCSDPLYWLSEKLVWSGLLNVSRSLNEQQSGAL
jgi:hypothetical protein